VANFSVDHPSNVLGTILKGAQTGANYLSYVPYASYAPIIFLLLGSDILLALAHCLKHKSTVFLLIVITAGIGFFYGSRFICPLVDPYKSARFLSQEIRQTMKPGDKLAMYGGFAIGPHNLYTGIVPIMDIETEDEIVNLFRSKERVFCLIQNQEYETLKNKGLKIPLYLIARRQLGCIVVALVSNK